MYSVVILFQLLCIILSVRTLAVEIRLDYDDLQNIRVRYAFGEFPMDFIKMTIAYVSATQPNVDIETTDTHFRSGSLKDITGDQVTFRLANQRYEMPEGMGKRLIALLKNPWQKLIQWQPVEWATKDIQADAPPSSYIMDYLCFGNDGSTPASWTLTKLRDRLTSQLNQDDMPAFSLIRRQCENRFKTADFHIYLPHMCFLCWSNSYSDFYCTTAKNLDAIRPDATTPYTIEQITDPACATSPPPDEIKSSSTKRPESPCESLIGRKTLSTETLTGLEDNVSFYRSTDPLLPKSDHDKSPHEQSPMTQEKLQGHSLSSALGQSNDALSVQSGRSTVDLSAEWNQSTEQLLPKQK